MTVVMRWLRAFFGTLLALLILFEEWGWEPLQRVLAKLAKLPPLAWLDRRIARLPPYGALAVFFVPALALVPVKIGALWLIGRGHAGLGLALIALAKLAGTAVLAHLFALTRPALMRLAWFARWHARWMAWKAGLLLRLRDSGPWRQAREVSRWLRERWRR